MIRYEIMFLSSLNIYTSFILSGDLKVGQRDLPCMGLEQGLYTKCSAILLHLCHRGVQVYF